MSAGLLYADALFWRVEWQLFIGQTYSETACSRKIADARGGEYMVWGAYSSMIDNANGIGTFLHSPRTVCVALSSQPVLCECHVPQYRPIPTANYGWALACASLLLQNIPFGCPLQPYV